MSLDPITLAVVKGGLEQVAEEMDATQIRTAFSSAVCESRDRANGIYEAETGEVVVQGSTGMPGFIWIMQSTVQHVLRQVGAKDMRPGDILMVNDPYFGGSHLMDIKFVKPFFYKGELFAYLANSGHWTDMGGSVPGGFAARATEVYQEGLRIPPVKLYTRGKPNRDVLNILLYNIRIPEERYGDLRAHINALHVGEARLAELLDKYGGETVLACMDEIKKRSEGMMRAHIDEIPEGTYSFVDFMDSDGVVDKPLKISLAITVSGSDMYFDFCGSDGPCRGPLNSVLSSTIAACCLALKHLFPDIPINAGAFKPLHFQVPKTTFLNADPPRPVSGCAAEVLNRVAGCVWGALAQAMPDRLWGAPYGTTNNLTIGGEDPGKVRRYVFYLFSGGGYGGFEGSDGLTYGNGAGSMARSAPVEVWEQRNPILFRRISLREDSGGPGRFRGGLGAEVEIELMRGEALASCLGDRARFAPYGIRGGQEAMKNQYVFYLGGREYVPPHKSKDENIFMAAGDRVLLKTPGGGGYGNPLERDIAFVLADVRDGYVSADQARLAYGVVINSQLFVDEAATAALRVSRSEGVG